MKKLVFAIVIFITLSADFFAERTVDFCLSFEPTLIINTGSPKDSAVSPIVYPFSFGAIFFKDKLLSFQPRLSFYTNYYLWDDDAAWPAEVENRTATAFSFLIDLPAVYMLPLAEHQALEFGAGAAVNARFAVLSNGVKESDAGSSGTAGDDVTEIQKYFWKDANFLFLEAFATYLYSFSEHLRIGPECRFYLPCGQTFSGNGLNGGMISLGIKACF